MTILSIWKLGPQYSYIWQWEPANPGTLYRTLREHWAQPRVCLIEVAVWRNFFVSTASLKAQKLLLDLGIMYKLIWMLHLLDQLWRKLKLTSDHCNYPHRKFKSIDSWRQRDKHRTLRCHLKRAAGLIVLINQGRRHVETTFPQIFTKGPVLNKICILDSLTILNYTH